MANEGKITAEEIIEKAALDRIEQLIETMGRLVVAMSNSNVATSANTKGINEIREATTKLTAEEIEANKIQAEILQREKEYLAAKKAKEKALADEDRLIKQSIQSAKQQYIEEERRRKAQEKAEEAARKANLEWTKLNKLHGEAKEKAREMGLQFGINSTQFNKARDEANKYDKKLKDVSKSLGEGGRFVGLYDKAIQGLPGPLGAAANSIGGMIKQMWLFVANPIGIAITAIVGGLTLLFKAFKSTDSGANMLAGTMKAIGNIFDVILDRVIPFAKLLGNLFTGNIIAAIENGKEAFSGLGQSIKDAANAGYAYVQVMDDINDRESASLIRSAKLKTEIETLKNLKADQTKTDKERLAAAELAMKKEIELFNIEKGFEKEKTDAEIKNLASKIQNSNMSIAQREKELRKWLEFDDTQINAEIKKNKLFADFVNKNESDFQATQKRMADELLIEANFQTETRRLQTSLGTFKKELLVQGTKDNAKAIKDAEDAQKESFEKSKKSIQTELDILKDSEGEKRDEINVTLNEKLDAYETEIFASTLTKDKQEALLLDLSEFRRKQENDNAKNAEKVAKDELDTYQYLAKQKFEAFKDSSENSTLTNAKEQKKQFLAYTTNLKESVKALKISDKDKKKAIDDIEQYEKESIKAVDKVALESAEKRKEQIDKIVQMSSDMVNNIGALTAQSYDIEIQKNESKTNKYITNLEKQRERELANKNLTDEQKEAIEAKYDKLRTDAEHRSAIETAKLQRKQAIADKAFALTQIAIQTAIGVAKEWGSKGILGALTMGFVIANGILQAAIVARQPLPEIPSFKKGGKMNKDGVAELHGQELVTLPTGKKFITPGGINDPLFTGLPQGTEITPNHLLRDELNKLSISVVSGEKINKDEKFMEIAEAILNKPTAVIYANEKGLGIHLRKGNSRQRMVDKLYRGIL